jgi:hypothetical protein
LKYRMRHEAVPKKIRLRNPSGFCALRIIWSLSSY